MWRAFPGFFVVLLVVLVVGAGCGGRGGGTSGITSGTTATGTTGATATGTTGTGTGTTGTVDDLDGPGPQQGTPVASSVKYADVTLVTNKFNSLVAGGATGVARDQQLFAFFKTVSDFKQTGLEVDGTVWGRFKDNSYYVFNVHDVPDGFTPQVVPAQRSLPTAPRLPSARPAISGSKHPLDAGTDIADGKTAMVLDVFDGSLNEPNSEINKMLTQRGYTVSATAATLDVLKSVPNVTALYWSSHGCFAGNYLLPGKNFWSVFSATPANAANDAIYHDDLAAGRLVIFTAATSVGLFSVSTSTNYGITADWIKHYNWSFTKHSLAFINCCWSNEDGICAALRGLPSPAATTLGWSNAAQPTSAWRAASYFFDRTLGTDLTAPIMPGHLRPFSAQKVFAKLQSLGFADASTSEYGPCTLYMEGADLLLSPSIQKMAMYDAPFTTANPHAVLEIYGDFGNDAPQKVTVGGTSVPFKFVNNGEIDANPPAHASDAGYSGSVQVIGAGGTESNAPPLTSWQGTFEYDANPNYNIITGKQVITGAFRADIHKYRNDVDGDLQNPDATYDRISTGSQDQWEVDGSLPDQVFLSPKSGAYDYGPDGTVNKPWGTGYELDAKIDRAGDTFNLAFLFLGTDVNYTFNVPNTPTLTYVIPLDPLIISSNYLGLDKYHGPLWTPRLLCNMNNDDFTVAKTITKGSGYAGDFAEFTAPGLTPQNAPTTDYEEDTNSGG